MHTILFAVTLAAAPALVAVLNAAFNRMSGSRPHTTPFQAGAMAAVAWIPIWLVLCVRRFGWAGGEIAWSFAYGAIYLSSVVFLNWFIFTITDVSMHIQLLMQIHEHGTINKSRLQKLYNKDVIVGNRVPRLLELGQLRFVDGKLRVAGRGVMFGAVMCAALRQILGLPIRPELALHDES